MALVVLHLSDLHFGPHSRFAGEDPGLLAERFCGEVRRALEAHEREAPDLVMMTGDLTEAARKSEFEAAQAYFEALVGILGVERSRFCFVPGNHDVSWAHCKRVRINQEIEEFDDAELERQLQREKMAGWNEFLANFYGPESPEAERGVGERRELVPGVVLHEFESLRLCVGALDTSRRETELVHGGYLGQGQVQALMNEWRQEQREGWLKFVAVHHNPVADNEDNLREWATWLGGEADKNALSSSAIAHFVADATGFTGKNLLHNLAEDAQVQLVLHGHVHAAGATPWSWRRGVKGQTQVVGAGSLFLAEKKLPGDQAVMFQLLHLDTDARELRVQRRVWEPRARVSGQVSGGSFVEDPATPADGLVLDVGLPEGYATEPAGAASSGAHAGAAISDASFLAEYRLRLRGRHRTWELGAVHMGARRPATPELDDMYVPLRLGSRSERDDDKQAGGDLVTPYRILQRHRNLLIRGAAGSGKTTWMRWSFRRLLERDDALPILIELRELARQWSLPGATGKQRNFDWWLEQWVERFVGSGWSAGLRAALDAKGGPRPVLMVDGWDELGDLGREFREQFDGFLAAHPRVLAIATSRPYGEQVPEHDEHFETLEVMPLSDSEIEGLSQRFFAKVHGEREAEVGAEVARFLGALDAAQQAKSLGRTPLLLVMMLIIGRGRPLPDRRHKLYEFCIEQLLDAHPSKRVRDGAQVASWQWAPEGFEPRLRAVAKLALWMHHSRGGSLGERAAVVRREDLLAQLPSAWTGTQRQGFLAWLVASSGLMVDYSDETLSFAHLGFQEYLAAWQLEVDCEGERARIELATLLCSNMAWWETLRLWAALVEGRASERLEPVLAALCEHEPHGYWLAGTMLADGLGGGAFEMWLGRLPEVELGVTQVWTEWAAAAWRVSRQHARREAIAACLSATARQRNWSRWVWAKQWWARAELEGTLPWPSAESPAGAILRARESLGDEPGALNVSWARFWALSSPLWCGKQLPLLALRLWPGRRMLTGMLMQMQLASGEPVELSEASRLWVQECGAQPEPDRLGHYTRVNLQVAVEFSMLERALWFGLERARHGALTSVSYQRMLVARPLGVAVLNRELSNAHRTATTLAREFAKFVPYRGFTSPGSLSALDGTIGFAGVRSAFAASTDEDPFVRLFARASQLSLLNAAPDADFRARCASFEGDPLWPALARHVARASTPEDRALLEDAVRHPEQREGVVGLGLRYWVRGDLTLPGGGAATLDQLGVDLPVLDDYAPELDPLALMPELDAATLTKYWPSWPR